MVEASLSSNTKGKKHQDNEKTTQQTDISAYFAPARGGPGDVDAPTSTENIAILAKQRPTLNQSIAASHVVLSAEVMWMLKTVDLLYSYSSCANTSELLGTMFSNSGIAAKFSCGETKCAYPHWDVRATLLRTLWLL